jgi:hypothetical protein
MLRTSVSAASDVESAPAATSVPNRRRRLHRECRDASSSRTNSARGSLRAARSASSVWARLGSMSLYTSERRVSGHPVPGAAKYRLTALVVRRRVQQLLDAVLTPVSGMLSSAERGRVRVSQGGCHPSVRAARARQFPHEPP